MEKNNFILYKDWKPLIEELNNEQKGTLLQAIYDYVCGNGSDEVLEDIKSRLDLATKIIFMTIQNTLHRDLEKYRNKCEKNKENIGKRWNTNEYERIPKHTNVKVGKKKNTKGIRNDTKNTDNDNEYDNDNDINKKKLIKKKYGECNNVKLTDDEHKKLQELYKDKLNEAIDLLDNAIQIHGYKYKDHYRVMLGWVKKEILDKKTSDVKKDIEVVYDSSINKPMSDEELKALEEFRRV